MRTSGETSREYELQVVEGLEGFAEQEVVETLAPGTRVTGRPGPGRLSVTHGGHATSLNALRTVLAAHLVERFEVPRPKALLGYENLGKLLRSLKGVVESYPAGSFETVRISAAGADSSVFKRLAAEIASPLELEVTTGPANLQVTCRRPPNGTPGWQVLVRTSPMPLSARKWRVRDYPGALNATVANVMARLCGGQAAGTFLNLACGSATLIIERLGLAPGGTVVGVDNSGKALDAARANLRAAGHGGTASLLLADARSVPLPSGSVDAMVADLPYGMLTGAGSDLAGLYEAMLAEATRLARPSAALVVITARKRAFESAVRRVEERWAQESVVPISVPFRSGYLRPNIYALRRR